MAATIKDIARETGLGLATISSYLNGGNVREKNRVKIEAAIEKLDFEVNEVARGLKTNRTKMVGVILPELNNIFFAEIITELEDVLRGHGYAVMICDCRSDERREEEAVEFLKRRRVDGMIVIPTGKSGACLQEVMKTGKPIVMIDRRIREVRCDTVLVDNQGAARDAIRRLVGAGHRRIGMIAGDQEVYTAEERFRGYIRALEEAGIPAEDSLIVRGDYTIRGGSRGIQELTGRNPDMTAVFISNYEMTLGAMIELNELGIRIPEEMSVIGFDNVEFARACIPKLSIVTQPTKELGKKAAELMLRRLEENGRAEFETVRLATSFVEGRSVCRCPGFRADELSAGCGPGGERGL